MLCKDTFGLKSASATYHLCVHITFDNQFRKNIEAYIDDVVVKSKIKEDLFANLREPLDNLKKYRMVLNPEECVFGVSLGKLLGILVSIKASRQTLRR